MNKSNSFDSINEGTIERLLIDTTREEALKTLVGHNKAIIKDFIKGLGFACSEELYDKLAQFGQNGDKHD